MSVELSGFDELISDLNNLGAIGNKIGRKAVEEGAKIVLEQQKKDAPRSDDNDHGADKLDITEIKKYAKSGTVVGRVGISSDNWEFTKGLYFNHYGFEHYKS
ncbi:HK97 gp10 family phage protein, partial [Clostridium saudiense]|uniref:HK97 gp10 family phage protein n=1 Tax=Clostridium saudiense TaxID=1414720 RepID=UPI00319DCFED